MSRSLLPIPHMKKSCFLAALTVVSFALGSCNTFIGVGRDLRGLGTGIENRGTTGDWEGTPTNTPPTANNPYGAPPAQ